jgi:hypothetical protein
LFAGEFHAVQPPEWIVVLRKLLLNDSAQENNNKTTRRGGHNTKGSLKMFDSNRVEEEQVTTFPASSDFYDNNRTMDCSVYFECCVVFAKRERDWRTRLLLSRSERESLLLLCRKSKTPRSL